ncbi:MAG TPA: Holliday junction resolvase RuvX [Bacilli bacterium]|jgi:putative Holliday junction resolvase|nr:MAG: putative Holliday junction resolvase [Tenericutes bacterium ADurb.Bin140]HOE78174.1 Holliday junction resolvase RuvX [Bacilli bacterium]HON64512.1 Holliday junction resolvase RuvX [Bacilli bacterium]HOR96393.1 Holliday junction resolvase RuvX [Bacilli bacterium]HPD12615.1 Holliday junction resolvase RuvX [Bacilli bacterium]
MRCLGLDLGTRTLGIAISDDQGKIAFGLETYHFRENDLPKAVDYVKILCATKQIDKIILGLPKNMDGSVGFQGEYVLKFKAMLEQVVECEIILEDERLTTSQANKVMLEADISRRKRKQAIDKLAATLILQSYLDRKRP